MSLYDKIFKPKTMRLANGKTVEERASRLPVILLALVAASVLSVKVTGFNLSTLVTRGNQFFVILGQMFPPNASYLSSIWRSPSPSWPPPTSSTTGPSSAWCGCF